MYDGILNVYFFVFHSCIILFNLFGWMWKKTRKANLILILLTLGSWFILGLFYGYGYCPCTDWHWQVRSRLGYIDTESSYTQFLVHKLTGHLFPSKTVDILTLSLLLLALAASVFTNLRDGIRKKRAGLKSDLY
ncbi:MAG: DUF2784 domain-containing protein [Candidatus Aminicenantes bacterium]|nr:DUF2784 domain-containing protein [Candidatus Aminicenantes bacterium]